MRPRAKRPILARNGLNERSHRPRPSAEGHSKPAAPARPHDAASPARRRHTCALPGLGRHALGALTARAKGTSHSMPSGKQAVERSRRRAWMHRLPRTSRSGACSLRARRVRAARALAASRPRLQIQLTAARCGRETQSEQRGARGEPKKRVSPDAPPPDEHEATIISPGARVCDGLRGCDASRRAAAVPDNQ